MFEGFGGYRLLPSDMVCCRCRKFCENCVASMDDGADSLFLVGQPKTERVFVRFA
jgi:hypothetical protein